MELTKTHFAGRSSTLVLHVKSKGPGRQLHLLQLPVVPGQAGGGSFQKEKNYIAKKEFAYIECAPGDRPARCPNHFIAVNEPFAVPWW